jgi:chromosome segregation ATPase
MPMQTLQIYRKKEKIPLDVQVRRVINDLNDFKRSHSFTPSHAEKLPEEPPRIRTIELQNVATNLERELNFWVKDYRSMIDEIREFDRILPKTEHELAESDQKALENVHKIIKVETIRDHLLEEYKNICILHEDSDEQSRKKIRQLETDLAEAQTRMESLEYALRRLQNKK